MSKPTSRNRARLLNQASWEGCDFFSMSVVESRKCIAIIQAMVVETDLRVAQAHVANLKVLLSGSVMFRHQR